MCSTGMAAAPESQYRMLDRSYFSGSKSSIMLYIAGTPRNSVAPCLAMLASACCGSKYFIRMPEAPQYSPPTMLVVKPKIWARGRAATPKSFGPRRSMRVVSVMVDSRLRLVRTAPLGKPVVPEV